MNEVKKTSVDTIIEQEFCTEKDCISTTFHGLHPTDHTLHEVDVALHAIQEEAPIGSSFRANFDRVKDKIKGTVRVNSKAGRFFAVAEGSRMSEVSRRLTEQIRNQIHRWKALRFQKAGS